MKRARFALGTILVVLFTLFASRPASAATIPVTSLADSGPGSLRDAIAAANSGDTLNVTATGTITLASTLTIGTNLTISGPGASSLAIDGGNAFQVFFINNGTTVTISGVTIQNGNAPGIPIEGGGISNYGTLTLTSSTITGNSANSGGGIFNFGTASVTNSTFSGNNSPYGGGIGNSGTLTVTDSTLSGNSAGYLGGGIINSGTVTITNSTLSGNSAQFGYGGGIWNQGTVNVTNSTFSGNFAYYHEGGGIFVGGGTLTAKNTIVANSISAGNCGPSGAAIVSQGYNLSDDASCSNYFTQTGDVNNTPAGLDPTGLKANGGPTQTIALLPTSPAVDAIPVSACTDTNGIPVTTDQRGVTRPQGPACDIGAFELVPTATTTTVLTSSENPAVAGDWVTLTATTTSPSGTPTGSVTFSSGFSTLSTVNVGSSAILGGSGGAGGGGAPAPAAPAGGGAAPASGSVTTTLIVEDADSLGVGTFPITAQYTPATNAFTESSATITQTVTLPGAALTDSSNTLTGNQTIIGTLSASNLTGNGAGLLSLNPASLTPGIAGIDITGTANNALNLGGLPPSAYAPASGSPNYVPAGGLGGYVAKAGDTMTGALNLPTDGLVAGTNQLVLSGGFVGVGTATPGGILHVEMPPNNDANAPRFVSTGMAQGAYSQLLVGESANSYKTGAIRYNNGGGDPTQSKLSLFNFGDPFTLTVAGGAFVGIRNYNPQYPLDVNGDVHATGNVTANAFVGDGSQLTGITASTASTANFATTAGTAATATTATNALNLGGNPPSFYATTGANNFTGNQTISGGNLALDNTNGTGTAGVITLGGASFIHNFGGNNTFVGVNSGNFTMTGHGNTAFGITALAADTTGVANTASGLGALPVNTAGNDNTASGLHALYLNTTGSYNTGSGVDALYANNTGSYNTALGYQAGGGVQNGSNGTFVGAMAKSTVDNLSNAAAIGYSAQVAESNALVLGGTGANAVSVGIGTATPQFTLDVQGTGNFTGPVTFAPGQTFPGAGTGTITGVTAGSGLAGGGSSGNVTLNVNEGVVAFQSDLANGVSTAEGFATSAASAAVTTSEAFASSAFLPLAGGTLTGNVNGTSANFSGALSAQSVTVVPPPNSGYVSLDGVNGLNVNSNDGNVMGFFENNNNTSTNDDLYALHTGFGYAVHGLNTQVNGQAALFEANCGVSGRTDCAHTVGVTARVSSLGGIAGVLQNTMGGEILSLQNSSGEVSSVDGNGIFHFAAGQTFPAGASGLGTITGVTAGAGLFGGGTTGNVSLSIPAAGVSNSMLANPSLSVNAGTGLTGGGSVALGGTTTLSLATATCGAGSAITALPFTCALFAGLGANTFTGSQTMAGLTVLGVAGFSGNSGVPIVSVTQSGNGVALSGSDYGNGDGVVGYSLNGYGIYGSGGYGGVYGYGPSYGMYGQSSNGPGIFGMTLSTSAIAAAGVFNNVAPGNAGNILLGQSAGVAKFSVDGKGDVAASGSVTIGSGGTPIVEHLSQTFTVNVPAITPGNCATLSTLPFSGASDGDTTAFGIKNALITSTAGYVLDYFGWVSAANTVTIRVCNPRGPTNSASSGTIRVDVWKH